MKMDTYQVMAKKGRPKKTPIVPEDFEMRLPPEIEEIVKEVKLKEIKQEKEEFEEVLEEVKEAHKPEWDFTKDTDIEFFDATLSYEVTGYKPIDKTHSLDFDPSWFTESRDTFMRTGHYTSYMRNTKAYADFWDEEYRRCREGLCVNGYTITGDHYFFLNYYQLMDLDSAEKAGAGRQYAFPTFYVGQYEWFHYVELAKRLRLNAFLMKSREVGYSEIDAAIIVNSYNCIRNSINLITAHDQDKLEKTFEKVTRAMSFINDYTDGGFFKLRQVIDQALKKRASVYKIINGQKIETGWMSQIQGIVADKPSKIRGDRTDLLIYEEAGSWPDLTKAFIQSNALVGQPGRQWGYRIGGGTGGDTGIALEGLRKMYYDPKLYGILPYRHRFSQTGEEVLTAFFIPCTKVMKYKGFYDNRGYVDQEKATEYWEKVRAQYARSPKELVIQCAEYCYNAEEAFSLEGQNNFDKAIIAEQLAAIRLLKTAPPIQTGKLSYTYRTKEHRPENVNGFRWDEDLKGKIHILEHPIWSDEYKKQMGRGQDIQYQQMNNLYIAGVDSIDIGQEDTSENTDDPSSFCIVIMRRTFGVQDPVLVAYYKDRPDHIRDAYKIAMCMIQYYNAIVNIEATRMNFLSWAREHGFYKYFMMRPRATYPDPTKIGKRTPGTPATPTIIEHQLHLIEAYIEDYGQHIWFEEMLDELTRYSIENKVHFDIVAALGMVMLADEELGTTVATKTKPKEEEDIWELPGYYTDENGYIRYGIKSKQKSDIVINDEFYVDTGYKTSRTFWYEN